MTQGALAPVACIDYGVAAKPLAGEALSGDACLVRQIHDDILLAVVDGLGHGPQAADAANTAIEVIEGHLGQPLDQLVKSCHHALIQKRGVAMTLVSIQSEENTLSWLGIGNVWGGVLLDAERAKPGWRGMPSHGGIIGYRVPKLQSSIVRIAPGDWVIVATDGVRSGLDAGLSMNRPPSEVATQILSRHATEKDDALVLAVRYQGRAR